MSGYKKFSFTYNAVRGDVHLFRPQKARHGEKRLKTEKNAQADAPGPREKALPLAPAPQGRTEGRTLSPFGEAPNRRAISGLPCPRGNSKDVRLYVTLDGGSPCPCRGTGTMSRASNTARIVPLPEQGNRREGPRRPCGAGAFPYCAWEQTATGDISAGLYRFRPCAWEQPPAPLPGGSRKNVPPCAWKQAGASCPRSPRPGLSPVRRGTGPQNWPDYFTAKPPLLCGGERATSPATPRRT